MLGANSSNSGNQQQQPHRANDQMIDRIDHVISQLFTCFFLKKRYLIQIMVPFSKSFDIVVKTRHI